MNDCEIINGYNSEYFRRIANRITVKKSYFVTAALLPATRPDMTFGLLPIISLAQKLRFDQ